MRKYYSSATGIILHTVLVLYVYYDTVIPYTVTLSVYTDFLYFIKNLSRDSYDSLKGERGERLKVCGGATTGHMF
jgi:hypothetical protein